MGVGSQPRQILRETLARKNPSQKGAGGMAKGVGLVQILVPPKKKKKMLGKGI
jgi:hypothetical protein